MTGHTIKRSIVRGNGAVTSRAVCSCKQFSVEAPRLSTPGRKRLEREISEHLAAHQQQQEGAPCG